MRLFSRKWRWLGLGLIVLALSFFVIRTWVVRAILISQIESRYLGKVVVGDWWFNLHSSGVSGVELRESSEPDSPVWFSAARISTDVSLARLIRGRLMPTRIEIDQPRIVFRLDASGQPLTKIPVAAQAEKAPAKPGSVPPALPDIVTKNGVLSLEQVGRKPMTIHGVDARLSPVADGGKLEITTDDPTWGHVTVAGHFDPSFKNGNFEITTSPGFVADPQKLERIPFVPAEVWANISPQGPLEAKVKITLAVDAPKPVTVHTDIKLQGTTAKLSSLQLEAHDTTGHVLIDDARVKIVDLRGKTIDGTIQANGNLNFESKVPRMDLDLILRNIDVTKTPASWQLGEVDATGKLSGRVDLKVALRPSGPDLSGTIGRAVIEEGSFQGIPIKSLSLGLRAEGNDLQYATMPAGSVDKNKLDALPLTAENSGGLSGAKTSRDSNQVELWEPVAAILPLLEIIAHDKGLLGWAAFGVSELVTFQVKNASGKEGGLKLPRTISTQIELADVDLVTLVEKARKYGITIPVPISGKFSIKASATIPLGALRDLKDYVFRGDFVLSGASIDHVDLGLVSAHLEFVDGVLDLSDFRGQLLDRSSGSSKNPPQATAAPPAVGPLPAGAFRGRLHASISPKGPVSANFEGERLPLGELFAPVLPVPTPLSGELTLSVEARSSLATLADPKSWALDGRLESRRIKYQEAVLDQVATEVHVHQGRLDVPSFVARLVDRPLQASGGLELVAPYRYTTNLSIQGWDIARVLAFVPGISRSSPVSGILDARGEAAGSLQPFGVETKGHARVTGAKAGALPVGNIAFQWANQNDAVSITGLEVFTFGGKVTGEARIPTRPGKSLEATATLKGINSAQLASSFLGQGLSLAGLADGQVKIRMPLDASVIDAEATLVAPDLKVRQGASGSISVKELKVNLTARQGVLDYEANAASLGAKVRFHGTAPIAANPSKPLAEAQFQAVGFRLGEIWKGLGMVGGLAHLDGLGAINANLRARLQPFQLYSRGIFEIRDLRYGNHLNIGNLAGTASLTPASWQIDQLKGEVLGGVASGEAHSETRPGGSKVVAFDFKVDRASLARMTTAIPSLAKELEGVGTLKIGGRIAEALQASAEVLVDRGKLYGVPLTDLRFPAELELNPASGVGSIHARHWSARVAGGSARGSAWLRLGPDRSFQSEVQLNGVDLELLARLQSSTKRAATGKVSGKIVLSGPNPEHLGQLRGKVALDLDDASLVELPVFKELDRFLGAARGGGLFEDGDLIGTIFNKTLFVEQLTLNGRLIQVHATGTVTFDGALNLEVLINTNQVIPQSGLALINIIPGLGQALGRGEEAFLRVAGFLENRLLKFRVTGTLGNPNVQLDAGVAVGDAAVGFFSSILKVPLGAGR